MAIDWAATGNWMQAWAGFAQAGAVVYVATKSADAFKMWRQQKIGERKLDTAERILDVAYRIRRSFASIRSPLMQGSELARAEERLREQDSVWLAALAPGKRKRTIHSQAVYDRLNSQRDEFDRLLAMLPTARAYFGEEVEGHLQSLWEQRAAVISAAESYAQFEGDDRDFSEQLERALWERYGRFRGNTNEVDDAIATASQRLEAILKPVLSETAGALLD